MLCVNFWVLRVMCGLLSVVRGDFYELQAVNRVDFWVLCVFTARKDVYLQPERKCIYSQKGSPVHLFLLAIPHHVNVRLLPCPDLVTKSCHHISEEKTGFRSQELGARSQESGARSQEREQLK